MKVGTKRVPYWSPDVWVTIVVLLLAAGCGAPIQSSQFDQLAASVQELRTGADASLSAVYDRTRERYITEAADGDRGKVTALLLTRPGEDTFGWATSQPPLFLVTARFREGVYRLNSVMIRYTGLLGQLASKDLLDPKTFDQLAKDLNGNLVNAAAALGVPGDRRDIAIFSTAATAAFEAYLRNQQRKALIEALEKNQQAVQDTAEFGAAAARRIADALRAEYNTTSTELAGVGSASAIKDLADLDDRFIKEISALRVLNDSYVALPSAHRELAAGLREKAFSFTTIRELFQRGQDLYRRFEELRGAEVKKSGGK